MIAAEAVGTSADRVAVACTHTHSGPATFPLHGGPIDKEYLHDLQGHVGKAVQLAWGKRKPARLTVGTAAVSLAAQSPADEVIRALLASDTAECPICVILEHACHPACLPAANTLFSGDLAGRTAASLEFAEGRHLVTDDRPFGGGEGMVMKPEPIARALDAIRAVIPLPCGKDAAGAPAFMPVAVAHLTLGPVELVTISGEIFFEVGQELRRRTGRMDLWVAAYCSGGHGHVGPDSSLPAATASDATYGYLRPPLLPGAAEKLISETYRMLTTPRAAAKMEGRRGM
ncbi:MAG: hypothetical protein NT031_16235 [Planctomycetota bacterium]|nr:hypothetical protein [Planctomycetota bacterium]